MKDPRFLPVELREPVEEFDEEMMQEEDYEKILQARQKGSVKRLDLYVAS